MCLSVISKFCLSSSSSVVRLQRTSAYVEARNFLVDPNGIEFFYFQHGFLGWKHCPMSEKNEWHLRLEVHIITQLLQNEFSVNTHILMYQNARCDCKLLSGP